MVILIERLHKLYSKLETHHHHHQQQQQCSTAALQDFQSYVSGLIDTQLLFSSYAATTKPGSEILSLSLQWIQESFKLLPLVNKAFAKLVVDLDYPMSKWGDKSIDEYLNYSLNLLDLLNGISSCLSHLDQARLELFHALSLVDRSSTPSSAVLEHLKPIQLKISSTDHHFKHQESKEEEDIEKSFSDKEWIVHRALIELRRIGFWVSYTALDGLSGGAKEDYSEIRKAAGTVSESLFNMSRSTVHGGMVREVKDLNDAVACLSSSLATGDRSSNSAADDMQTRLEAFAKLLEGLGKDVDLFFSEVLNERSEVLDGIRYKKKH